MRCINLKTTYGDKYRIGTDPAAGPRNKDVWLWTIICKHGHIFPWGRNRLAASIDHRGPTVKRLLDLPGVRLEQDGQDGATASFEVGDFDAVAEVMAPRRRRSLSPESRAAAAERGRRALAGFRQTNPQSNCGGLERSPKG